MPPSAHAFRFLLALTLAGAPACASSPQTEPSAAPIVTAIAAPPPAVQFRHQTPSWLVAAYAPPCPIYQADLAVAPSFEPACAPSNRVAGCARAEIATGGELHGGLALATRANEIGLAWISGVTRSPEGRPLSPVHFARLRPDLTTISESDCQNPTAIGSVTPQGHLRLVARPGGWLLAIQTQEGIALEPLDAKGVPLSRGNGVLPGRLVDLVERTDGEPLLVYEPEYPYQGIAGVVIGPTIIVKHGPVWVDEGTAVKGVWTGSGFVLVTAMVNAWTGENGLRVTWLDPNLVLMGRKIISRAPISGFDVAWAGRRAVITYQTSLGARRVAQVGATMSDPTWGPATPDWAALPGGVPVLAPKGEDRLLAFHAKAALPSTPARLDVVEMDVDGRLLGAPEQLGFAPQPYHFGEHIGYQAARLGDEIVVAWTTGQSPGRIDLARVIP